MTTTLLVDVDELERRSFDFSEIEETLIRELDELIPQHIKEFFKSDFQYNAPCRFELASDYLRKQLSGMNYRIAKLHLINDLRKRSQRN